MIFPFVHILPSLPRSFSPQWLHSLLSSRLLVSSLHLPFIVFSDSTGFSLFDLLAFTFGIIITAVQTWDHFLYLDPNDYLLSSSTPTSWSAQASVVRGVSLLRIIKCERPGRGGCRQVFASAIRPGGYCRSLMRHATLCYSWSSALLRCLLLYSILPFFYRRVYPLSVLFLRTLLPLNSNRTNSRSALGTHLQQYSTSFTQGKPPYSASISQRWRLVTMRRSSLKRCVRRGAPAFVARKVPPNRIAILACFTLKGIWDTEFVERPLPDASKLGPDQ